MTSETEPHIQTLRICPTMKSWISTYSAWCVPRLLSLFTAMMPSVCPSDSGSISAERAERAGGSMANEPNYQDSDFYFIAGCTSGGTPYGITWDQARDKGLLEVEKMKK